MKFLCSSKLKITAVVSAKNNDKSIHEMAKRVDSLIKIIKAENPDLGIERDHFVFADKIPENDKH